MLGARRLDVGGEHPVGQHAHIVTTLYKRTDDGRVCRHGATAIDDREQVALGLLHRVLRSSRAWTIRNIAAAVSSRLRRWSRRRSFQVYTSVATTSSGTRAGARNISATQRRWPSRPLARSG